VVDVIKFLFTTSADKPVPEFINAVNDAGNTPLHWAAVNGHLESVKLLIQSGADVTIINRAGHDAVFEAEINDKKEVVDWLLGAVEELAKHRKMSTRTWKKTIRLARLKARPLWKM
jgi:ankyrin repeat protein